MTTSSTPRWSRRLWLGALSAAGLSGRAGDAAAQAPAAGSARATTPATGSAPVQAATPLGSVFPRLTDAEWQARLTPAQYQVLRKAGTERAGTSPLNDEKRAGRYLCAGCGHALFTSEMKFDSGTGWPSFFTTLPGAFKTSTDFKLVYPRTEYHCARCEGHHGHVFKDGPRPTGERWCNNGVALRFEPAA